MNIALAADLEFPSLRTRYGGVERIACRKRVERLYNDEEIVCSSVGIYSQAIAGWPDSPREANPGLAA